MNVRSWGRFAVLGLLFLLGRRRRKQEADEPKEPRIVAPGQPSPRAELAVIALLGAAAASAAGFVAVYSIESIPNRTQFLGVSLGLAFAFLAAAAVTAGNHLVPDEEVAEPYPDPGDPEEVEDVQQIVAESGDRLTRRRVLKLAAGGAGAALLAAFVAPAASLGPFLDVNRLKRTPWHRGVRLVDETGKPLLAREIEQGTFYTAFPEGAEREQIGAPLVVVRLDPADLRLPRDRARWAPQGILAYSKICTHAGCAVALYRKPLFPPVGPQPAFVCPCHYSTFDPATGGTVIFGPAGRPLPQLPLRIDLRGALRAGGGFSGPVGPSWWGVRQG
jgi:ubiquinol-cytochrome c reductase iron-sulfur subunit